MLSSTEVTSEPIRTWKVHHHGIAGGCQIRVSNAHPVAYTLYYPNGTSRNYGYSLELHEGATEEGAMVGTARLSWVPPAIKLAIGDPEGADTEWADMHKTGLLAQNRYWMRVGLPNGEIRGFEWKSTHDVRAPLGISQISDLAFRMTPDHLKLVDKATGVVVARYIHNYLEDLANIKIRGTFEIKKDFGGVQWDLIVMLSALALQELLRKDTCVG